MDSWHVRTRQEIPAMIIRKSSIQLQV